jgi:hypothetical protein
VRLKSAAAQSVWCEPSAAVAAKPQSVRLNLTQCKPPWGISVQTATPRSVNAKKTVKKPSRQAWLVVHAHLAVHRAEAAQPVAVLAAVAQVAVIAAKVAEAADKSQRRCTKNTAPPKGNPLKRLK